MGPSLREFFVHGKDYPPSRVTEGAKANTDQQSDDVDSGTKRLLTLSK